MLFSWTAISRGAVLMGLNAQSTDSNPRFDIESRVARANYGCRYQTNWKNGKFDPRDKIFDKVQRVYKANNQMQWHLRRVCLHPLFVVRLMTASY